MRHHAETLNHIFRASYPSRCSVSTTSISYTSGAGGTICMHSIKTPRACARHLPNLRTGAFPHAIG